MNKPTVLIASPTGAGCDSIRTMLEGAGKLQLKSHVMAGGSFNELIAAMEGDTDLLVLELEQQQAVDLAEWASRSAGQLPPMIVIGATDDRQVMRCAMQAGARDYLFQPLDRTEFLASVTQVLAHVEQVSEHARGQGKLTAVINAKGGSGASVVASNLAHILSAHVGRGTALMDMDLQFGALPMSFDLQTRDSLLDVIAAIDQLDPVALRGFMTKHQSGLEILGSTSEQLVMPWEVASEDIRRLLELSVQTYDHVVVDLPREINPVSGVVLSSADRIMVVMEQSFAHLRDAKRMFELLRNYLGVPSDKISVVINRYTDRNSISVDDVNDAVHPAEVLFVPNDFANVTESLNIGVPLYEQARNAPITRAFSVMAERIDAGAESHAQSKAKTQRWTLPRMLGLGSHRAGEAS